MEILEGLFSNIPKATQTCGDLFQYHPLHQKVELLTSWKALEFYPLTAGTHLFHQLPEWRLQLNRQQRKSLFELILIKKSHFQQLQEALLQVLLTITPYPGSPFILRGLAASLFLNLPKHQTAFAHASLLCLEGYSWEYGPITKTSLEGLVKMAA